MKRGWLKRAIERAQNDMKTWPLWMQELAKNDMAYFDRGDK